MVYIGYVFSSDRNYKHVYISKYIILVKGAGKASYQIGAERKAEIFHMRRKIVSVNARHGAEFTKDTCLTTYLVLLFMCVYIM